MDIWFWAQDGSGGLVFLDEDVCTAGLDDVPEHYFAGLEGGVAEAEFEEFEDSGFLVEVQFGF